MTETKQEREQEEPVDSEGNHASTISDSKEAMAPYSNRRKYFTCWAIGTTILLIDATVALLLTFTVFRVKEPVIVMNGVRVTKLQLVDGLIPKLGTNMSVVADVSVKNPNAASFKYHNTTTILYYGGTVIGEALGPAGRAGARRTKRMNISVSIITDRILTSPKLGNDLGSGILTISSYSHVPGRIKMLNIFKHHVTVRMNCTMEVNITTRQLRSQTCLKKVDL